MISKIKIHIIPTKVGGREVLAALVRMKRFQKTGATCPRYFLQPKHVNLKNKRKGRVHTLYATCIPYMQFCSYLFVAKVSNVSHMSGLIIPCPKTYPKCTYGKAYNAHQSHPFTLQWIFLHKQTIYIFVSVLQPHIPPPKKKEH